MLPGIRVRVVRAPPTHPQLANADGRVIRLVPVAQDPLHYNVAFPSPKNGRDIVKMAASSLQVLDYKEGKGEGGMLTVNKLNYCRPHRLEICGKCGFHFRSMNIMMELDDRHGNKWMTMDEELRQMGAGIRSAPQDPSLGLTVPYLPVINDALVLLPSGDGGLDPREMPDFTGSIAAGFLGQFEGNEDFTEQGSDQPVSRVQSTYYEIAERLDLYNKPPARPMPRIVLQNEAQSDVLTLDIVAVKLYGSGTPLIVVGYMKGSAANVLECMQAIASVKPGTKIADVEATSAEMDLMVKILEANAASVSPEYTRAMTSRLGDIFSLGVLAPITHKQKTLYLETLGPHCDYCTTSQCRLRKCSRCHDVAYCSKECQKKGWKKHKLECRPSPA